MDHLIRRGLTGVMTTGWATATLVAATITNGLMAGLFAAYSYAVMPGLGRAGDTTFVEAMQQTNAAILNGWFGSASAGRVVFAAAAVLLHLGRPGLPWIVAGLVLYVAVLVITFRINVPLNDRLAAAGTPATPADRRGGPRGVRGHVGAVERRPGRLLDRRVRQPGRRAGRRPGPVIRVGGRRVEGTSSRSLRDRTASPRPRCRPG